MFREGYLELFSRRLRLCLLVIEGISGGKPGLAKPKVRSQMDRRAQPFDCVRVITQREISATFDPTEDPDRRVFRAEASRLFGLGNRLAGAPEKDQLIGPLGVSSRKVGI